MVAPESQWHSWVVVPVAHSVRSPALWLRIGHADRHMGAPQRIHETFPEMVDSRAGDPVLASHRAFPADLAGHISPQFLGSTGPVQCFATGLSTCGTTSLL